MTFNLVGVRGERICKTPSPVKVLQHEKVLFVRAAAKHSVAVVESQEARPSSNSTRHEIWSWGGSGPWLGQADNDKDNSSTSHTFVPRKIAMTVAVRDIACATEHTLLLSEQGHLYSCGSVRDL